MQPHIHEVQFRRIPRGWLCLIWLSDDPLRVGTWAGGAVREISDGRGLLSAARAFIRARREAFKRWHAGEYPFNH